MFYKVIQNQNVIDVLTQLVYVKFQSRNSIMIRCKEDESPMGVLSSDSDKIWHLEGLEQFPNDDYETVKAVEIEEDEYNLLKAALDENKVIEEVEPEPTEEEVQEPTEAEITDLNTLEMVRSAKLKELNRQCKQTITSGVDVMLSDGITHNFDLQIEDQINLLSLQNSAEKAESGILYHASNELCKYYTTDDIAEIIRAADLHKAYHTTYYNSLKNWVMSMSDIADIGAVKYGDEVPEEYCSQAFIHIKNSKDGETE